MKKIPCRALITFQPEATPELPYNVQLWHQCNDGQWVYGGTGRFAATAESAEAWARSQHPDSIEWKIAEY